jgi:hypothetical protein
MRVQMGGMNMGVLGFASEGGKKTNRVSGLGEETHLCHMKS